MHNLRCAVFPLVIFAVCPPLLSQNTLSFQSLPIVIEKNQGQAPSEVRYLAHCGSLEALFTANQVVFMRPGEQGAGVNWKLLGNAATVVPVGRPVTSRSNYFIGTDSSLWLTGIENEDELTYADVYPGISLVFHGSGGNLEHDFRVEPGANPGRIAFRFDATAAPSINAKGDLKIAFGSGILVVRRPVAYQEIGAGRSTVDARFAVDSDGAIRFIIGAYDRTKELVIDPVLGFSSYLAGSEGSLPVAVTSDAEGNIYVTGSTTSRNFPLKNPLDKTPPSPTSEAIFVSSFGAEGRTLRFSTYLGGGTFATGSAIAIDEAGNIIVAGIATSNFPHAGPLPELSCRSTPNPCYFLASLSSSGTKLNFAGKAGGGAGNYGDNYLYPSLTLDSKRNAYLTGITDDKSFLITPGTLGGSVPGYPQQTAFVMKFSPAGEVIYSTIILGKPSVKEADIFAATGIVVDRDGRVTIGGTAAPGLPTTPGVVAKQFPNRNPYGQAKAGFILQLNPTASAIDYATYLPGTDEVGGVTQDKTGNIWLAGSTAETALPVSSHAFQKAPSEPSRHCPGGFVMEVGDNGRRVLAATYLSGKYPSIGPCIGGLDGIALDSKGNAYVGGFTSSPNFPVRNPLVDFYDPQVGYAADMVLAGLNASLSDLIFGSYLNPWGNTPSESGSVLAALTTDSKDDMIVAGATAAVHFPTTPDAFQPKSPVTQLDPIPFAGFVAGVKMGIVAPSVCFDTTNLSFGPNSEPLTIHLTNCGNAPLHVKSVVSSTTLFSVESSCSTVDPGSVCTLEVAYTASNPGRDQGSITVVDDAPVQPQILEASATP